MYRVLIADDYPATLMGTKFFLEQKGHHVISVCMNGIEAYNEILSKQPQIAILDISMPGMKGLEILKKVKEQKSLTKIIFYTMHNEISIFNRAIALGAKAYLIKDLPLEELEKCILEVGAGDTYSSKIMESQMFLNKETIEDDIIGKLTLSEMKILEMIAEQKSSKQIAEQLFIAEKTVKVHRRNIAKKLNLPPGNNSLTIWAAKNWK